MIRYDYEKDYNMKSSGKSNHDVGSHLSYEWQCQWGVNIGELVLTWYCVKDVSTVLVSAFIS